MPDVGWPSGLASMPMPSSVIFCCNSSLQSRQAAAVSVGIRWLIKPYWYSCVILWRKTAGIFVNLTPTLIMRAKLYFCALFNTINFCDFPLRMQHYKGNLSVYTHCGWSDWKPKSPHRVQLWESNSEKSVRHEGALTTCLRLSPSHPLITPSSEQNYGTFYFTIRSLLSAWRRMKKSPALFPEVQWERPLKCTSPASQATVFRRTVQACTLSFV